MKMIRCGNGPYEQAINPLTVTRALVRQGSPGCIVFFTDNSSVSVPMSVERFAEEWDEAMARSWGELEIDGLMAIREAEPAPADEYLQEEGPK